jgi:uncharacterized membrane protein YfcA
MACSRLRRPCVTLPVMPDLKVVQPVAEDLPLATRYTMAWAEINSRIEARQQVFLYAALTSVTALVGAVAALLQDDVPERWLKAFAIGLAAVVWAFVFSIRHHEQIIRLLSEFCSECEGQVRPAWHTEDRWIGRALREGRVFADLAYLLVVLTSTSPAGALIYLAGTRGDPLDGLIFGIIAAITIAAGVFARLHKDLRQDAVNVVRAAREDRHTDHN